MNYEAHRNYKEQVLDGDGKIQYEERKILEHALHSEEKTNMKLRKRKKGEFMLYGNGICL